MTALFGNLRSVTGHLAHVVRPVLVDRDRAVVSLWTVWFEHIDYLFTNTLIFSRQFMKSAHWAISGAFFMLSTIIFEETNDGSHADRLALG